MLYCCTSHTVVSLSWYRGHRAIAMYVSPSHYILKMNDTTFRLQYRKCLKKIAMTSY